MKTLFKPPFRVDRKYMSSCWVVDSNNKIVAHYDAGTARFWEIAEEVAKAMNTLYAQPQTPPWIVAALNEGDEGTKHE